MALGTMVKLFEVGRKVYVVVKTIDNIYMPVSGIVVKVVKGRVHIMANGKLIDFSPNDRRLNLSLDECNKICEILNKEMQNGNVHGEY